MAAAIPPDSAPLEAVRKTAKDREQSTPPRLVVKSNHGNP